LSTPEDPYGFNTLDGGYHAKKARRNKPINGDRD